MSRDQAVLSSHCQPSRSCGYERIFLDSEGCTIVMFGRPDPDARAAEVRLDHLRPYPYV